MLRFVSTLTLLTIAFNSVSAEAVILRFEGVANFIGANLLPEVALGDAYTLDLSFDTTTVSTALVPNEGTYAATSANFSVSTSGAGSFDVSIPNPSIQIDNASSFQRFTLGSNPPTGYANTLSGSTLGTISISMFTNTATPFNGVALPTALSLADFSTNPSSTNFQLFFLPGTSADNVRFSINSITVIPEPAHVGLIAGLFLGIGLLARRRR